MKYDQNKEGSESHSNVYRVRQRPAYSSVTSFLILAKQGAAAPFDLHRLKLLKRCIEIHRNRANFVASKIFLQLQQVSI